MRFARPAALMLTLLLAGCETAPKPTKPVALPSLPAIVPPAAGPVAWADLPLTAGNWHYDPQTSAARFGAAVEIRCDGATRTVTITRTGATGPLTIKTSYGARTLSAPLAASDPVLDQIAFSRGRWSIESAGTAMVVMPAWAEPARVVEDCRG